MTHPYLAGAAPRVLAHRGLVLPTSTAEIADNTLASITAAVEAGAEYVETDCHLTSDGHVVLFHDATLARVAGDPRPVATVSLAELTGLMETRGGLLTLEQALERFATVRFNLDIKAVLAAEPAGRTVAPHAERTLVTSFSDANRQRALSFATSVAGRPATSPGRNGILRVLLALASRSRGLIDRAFVGFDALQIPERQGGLRVLSPRLLDEAHHRGVEVHVWTINDPQRMTELVQLGVDGIVTDRADVALRVLKPGPDTAI